MNDRTNVDPRAVDTIHELIARNRRYATERFGGFRPIAPSLRTIVIGCVDPRVEPAHILGLDTGEAVIIRNVAGRITPRFFQEMLMLRLVAQADGDQPGLGWNVIVLHHTDCGITRLSPYPDLLAGYFDIPVEDIQLVHPNDPYESVRVDIETLRTNPFFPAEFTLTGLVYDVHTGSVEIAAQPEPARSPQAPNA